MQGKKKCIKKDIKNGIKNARASLTFLLLITILFSFAALASDVYALEITKYKVNAEIKNLEVEQKVIMTVKNEQNTTKITKISYPFTGEIKNLKTYDDVGGLESISEYRKGKTYITTNLRRPLLYGESLNITAEFITENAVSFFDNTYIFSTSYSLFANVKDFELVLKLPEGMGIINTETDIIPAPYEMTTDGKSIILKWHENNPKEFRVFVRFKPLLPETEISEKEKSTEEDNTSANLKEQSQLQGGSNDRENRILYLKLLIPVIAALIILAAFLIYFLLIRKKKDEIYEKIDILKEDEQLVIKLVAEEDGIEQRELQNKTGFSKAKLSKILSELEKRGVIRKESIGKKNRIYLAEKLRE